jgi:NAD(P)-dependent dehydrogenase (short-subunit alcohol dehydrogenase family)
MSKLPFSTALIVGAGPGISASVARLLVAEGLVVALAARNVANVEHLSKSIGAHAFQVDAANERSVETLFNEVDGAIGTPEIVIYNASARASGDIDALKPEAVQNAISITAFGGFLVAQQAARRMIPKNRGAILFTGATASVKGFAQSSAFAMGKFALRGLAQSAARELGPKGIHVAHFIIDGGVRSEKRPEAPNRPDGMLDPDAVAQTYLDVLCQPRSAWTHEVDLRPWNESF